MTASRYNVFFRDVLSESRAVACESMGCALGANLQPESHGVPRFGSQLRSQIQCGSPYIAPVEHVVAGIVPVEHVIAGIVPVE